MFKIGKVNGLDMAFGGSNMKELLPTMEDIPSEFKSGRTEWNKITSQWFYLGLSKQTEFVPLDGVETSKALGHIKAILASFEPAHEHKEAAVAFLLSEWFKEINNYK